MPWRRRRACLEVEVPSRGKRRDDAGAADLGWRSGEWRVRGAILEGSNQSRARFVGIAVRIVFRAK